ncbi:MAG: gephyrin-like molybdotransferase Glp [Cyanobacteria bacterium J06634_6]
MLSAIAAEQLIFTLVRPLTDTEQIPLVATGCLGRVLAAPVSSQLDFPHWDNSAMDGYAVRAADVVNTPKSLTVVEEIPAGKQPKKTILPGQAARILTGSMMPEGADTVVMQEETTREGEQVTILKTPAPQSFVRHQGSFHQAGAMLLDAGVRISPAEIALIAAAGQTQLSVYRQPRVAIISTGSELVSPDQPLQPGQIVDSNQYALSALVAEAGGVPVTLGIVSDEPGDVKSAIKAALSLADLVISTGGVSVGDYDYVDAVLEELGATLHVRSVAVKPGKPLTVATFEPSQTGHDQRILYFGLPGNPASAMVGFWRFVGPAIAKLSGKKAPWAPTFVSATAATELKAGGRRETYLWGQLTVDESGYRFSRATGSHSSGNLVNLANTSGLGVVPQGQTTIAVGQTVKVLKIR